MSKQKLPYGLWASPISPAMIAGGIRLNDVQFSPDGKTLVWSQSLDGKTSLFAWRGGEPAWDLSGEYNPSGAVGYGGGEFYAGNDAVFFCDRNGRLYTKPYDIGFPKAITLELGGCASPVLSADGSFVVFVHTWEGVDLLGCVSADGSAWPVMLRQGADFYLHPTISPDGSLLAWVEWDHPNMPWDGSRLMLGIFNEDHSSLKAVKHIAGDDNVAVFQPAFSPDGKKLAWLQNSAEFDDLVVLNLESNRRRTLLENQSMMLPAWVQGQRTINWAKDGNSIYFLLNQQGSVSLNKINLKNKQSEGNPYPGQARQIVSLRVERIKTGGFTLLEQLTLSPNGSLAFIAQSSSSSPRIALLKDGQIRTIARSASDVLSVETFSVPQEFSWTSSDGVQVFGLYYPPANAHYTSDGAPPMVVYVHGGPTSQVFNAFNMEAAFFTSRGYAYFAVNYRGSTGFGRSYRDALKANWGKIDLQDVIEGTQALVDVGLADPKKLVIKGGSAGGFTVLNALVYHPGFFKAGLCSYGVSNLFLLDMDTHKFEAHYTESMVGKLPEAAEKYHAWSPVFHADQIRDAIAIFQGSDDKVVPVEQSESIVNILRMNKVPHLYKLYEGEGHGFRKKVNLVDFYETIDRFLKQYVIFSL